jgi:phosphoadenosine phosphosulfate reductase
MSLVENTLFGERDKVKDAIDMLKMFEPSEGYYVAYSGGKDSTVILDLVRRSGVKYDAHYNITTIDPPELVYFVRTQPDVKMETPEMSMWQLIPKMKMPPTSIARYCCRVLKEGGGAGRRIITGVRAAESTKRAKRHQIETCMTDGTKTFLHLIFHWSTDDVWQYIHERKLPYCSLYDEGFKRIGCICCPMGKRKGMLRAAARWPKYKAMYIRTFDKLVVELKKGNGCRWNNGQDVWDWWTRDWDKKPDCEGQTTIFE